MNEPETPTGGSYRAERLFERIIFRSRWLLAPFYLGLAASLIALLIKFAQETFHLLVHAYSENGNEITIAILSLIDLSLVANLLLMVIFAGYESFVSRLDIASHHERLEWMGQIGFSDLKLKLMASIVAISAIRVPEGFMTAERQTNRDLGWMVGIHLTFVVSGVLLAVMDRLSERGPH